eukprot:320789-Pyramimonas_sp.AAC.1
MQLSDEDRYSWEAHGKDPASLWDVTAVLPLQPPLRAQHSGKHVFPSSTIFVLANHTVDELLQNAQVKDFLQNAGCSEETIPRSALQLHPLMAALIAADLWKFSHMGGQRAVRVRPGLAAAQALDDGDGFEDAWSAWSWFCPSTIRGLANAAREMNAAISNPLDDWIDRQSQTEACDHWIGVAETIADSLDVTKLNQT